MMNRVPEVPMEKIEFILFDFGGMTFSNTLT